MIAYRFKMLLKRIFLLSIFFMTPSLVFAIDSDGDGVDDTLDNCIDTANEDQHDSNGDGFGNACDADLDDSGFVNFADLSAFKVMFSELPDLTPDGNDDSGSAGRIIPKISIDQYGATLAKWMGISDSDLLNVFPNLGNFTVKDLGFMQS